MLGLGVGIIGNMGKEEREGWKSWVGLISLSQRRFNHCRKNTEKAMCVKRVLI